MSTDLEPQALTAEEERRLRAEAARWNPRCAFTMIHVPEATDAMSECGIVRSQHNDRLDGHPFRERPSDRLTIRRLLATLAAARSQPVTSDLVVALNEARTRVRKAYDWHRKGTHPTGQSFELSEALRAIDRALSASESTPLAVEPHDHGGQPCDSSENAAVRQFEIETIAETFGSVVEERKPKYLSETLQSLVAAGDFERAATLIFDRLYPPDHPRWSESTPLAVEREPLDEDVLAREFIHIRGAHNPTAAEMENDQEVRPCAWCRLAGEQAAEAIRRLSGETP